MAEVTVFNPETGHYQLDLPKGWTEVVHVLPHPETVGGEL